MLNKLLAVLTLSVVSTLSGTHAQAADYTLTVEPNYPADQAREVYAPLIEYLQRFTGHSFKLKVASNYLTHWTALRNKEATDFTFEEAHFTDYRRVRQGFIPLVRTQEASKFSVVSVDPDIAVGDVQAIIGRRVISLPSPSLGYVMLFDSYRDPMAQPEVLSIARKWTDGPDLAYAGEAEGAVVPSYVADEQPNLAVIWNSRELPGRALSAAPTVPANVRDAVTKAMLAIQNDNKAYDALHELRTTRFVNAVGTEYAGMQNLLSGTFGYVASN